jgi:histone acetyltransferase
MNHQQSWPFRSPVKVDEVPDYYQIISSPMDLQTLQNQLKKGTYHPDNIQAFENDLMQIFKNAKSFN